MSDRRIELQVEVGGVRLDKFLADKVPELSRSAARQLIDQGQVDVNGNPAKASRKLMPGDQVVVLLPTQQLPELVPETIPLTIVYEDRFFLAIDKPAGLVVHPAPGHPAGTLVNALLAHVPELATSDDQRPGIVHRLDRDTSGLILVAKSEKIRRALQQQFQDRQVHKTYLALLEGLLQPSVGRIEAPLGRDPRHRQRMAVVPGGREAITEYHVLEQFTHSVGPVAGDYTLVEAEPLTGRTHQIRVHLASIGHPVVGDLVYGRRKRRLPVTRQFLHAHRLEFKHPITLEHLELEAPPPKDLAELLDLLRAA